MFPITVTIKYKNMSVLLSGGFVSVLVDLVLASCDFMPIFIYWIEYVNQ